MKGEDLRDLNLNNLFLKGENDKDAIGKPITDRNINETEVEATGTCLEGQLDQSLPARALSESECQNESACYYVKNDVLMRKYQPLMCLLMSLRVN